MRNEGNACYIARGHREQKWIKLGTMRVTLNNAKLNGIR